jgi:hypothetical protein
MTAQLLLRIALTDRQRIHTLNGAVSKTRVQVVDSLIKDSSRHLLTLVVHKIHLDRPLALRETLNFRWLVTMSNQNITVSLCIVHHLILFQGVCGKAMDGRCSRAHYAPIGPVPTCLLWSSHRRHDFYRE